MKLLKLVHQLYSLMVATLLEAATTRKGKNLLILFIKFLIFCSISMTSPPRDPDDTYDVFSSTVFIDGMHSVASTNNNYLIYPFVL